MRRQDREVPDIGGIRDIIEKCKVCHVAMIDAGTPYVIPLNFGYTLEEGALTLYFHCAKEGRKLDILRRNNAVCFEMAWEGKLGHIENPCNSGYYFESVHGFGRAEFVEDVEEKCRALSLLMKYQSGQDFVYTAQQASSVCVFKIISTDFTGKKKANPKAQAE